MGLELRTLEADLRGLQDLIAAKLDPRELVGEALSLRRELLAKPGGRVVLSSLDRRSVELHPDELDRLEPRPQPLGLCDHTLVRRGQRLLAALALTEALAEVLLLVGGRLELGLERGRLILARRQLLPQARDLGVQRWHEGLELFDLDLDDDQLAAEVRRCRGVVIDRPAKLRDRLLRVRDLSLTTAGELCPGLLTRPCALEIRKRCPQLPAQALDVRVDRRADTTGRILELPHPLCLALNKPLELRMGDL